MNSSLSRLCCRFRLTLGLVSVLTSLLFSPWMTAQGVASGTIEGRVSHAGNASYLENARVMIEGTRFETFTDATGAYRLVDVPA